MSHRRRDDSDEELERDEDEEVGKSGRKRRRSEFIDDVAEEDEDEEEEEEEEDGEFYDGGGGGRRHFIVDHVTDLQDEDDVRRMHCRSLSPREDDQEDVEALERSIQARYARLSHTEYDEERQETTDVEQQALLPSVRDPKFWMVKCKTGHEREAAVCLMQKYLDKGSELQIRSAIALDHLKDYIYVEADKEAHVRRTDLISIFIQACKGMRLIHGNTKITLVPIKEMTDVVSVKSKAIDLSRDTWVRVKKEIIKGISLKKKGKSKKEGFVPPARFMNVDEAREMRIRVERRYDPMTGDYFENIGGMMFKDGFLYKNVSMKSISTQNIQPTFDEFEKFRQPVEHGVGDMASLSTKTLAVNEKELCKYFEPGNHVKVVCGASEGATGMVIKVEGHVVIIVSDTTKEDIRVIADNVAECSEVTSGVTRTGGYELHDLVVGRSRGNGKRNGDTLASRFSHLRTPTHVPQSLGKLPRGAPMDSGARHRGGRGMIHWSVHSKSLSGAFKGYRGRVVDFKGSSVRIELESKVVAGILEVLLQADMRAYSWFSYFTYAAFRYTILSSSFLLFCTRSKCPSPYLPSTPGGHPMTPSSASYLPDTPGWQPMTPGRGGDDGLWALPDVLVNVRRSGEDTVIGVVRDVLSDGSCRINLGSSGDGDTVIALSSQIDLVVPRKSDKVKIMSGALRGSTGKLIGVDGRMELSSKMQLLRLGY
ncbi:hypothetical protein C3L33_13228, partial [Rhododendron williamsianum]